MPALVAYTEPNQPLSTTLLLLRNLLTTTAALPPIHLSQNHRLLFLPPASPCTPPPRICTTLSAASSTSSSTPSPVRAEHSAYRSTPRRFACQIACLIPFSVCVVLSAWGERRDLHQSDTRNSSQEQPLRPATTLRHGGRQRHIRP